MWGPPTPILAPFDVDLSHLLNGVSFMSIGLDLLEMIWPTWSIFWINPPAFTESQKLMEILSLILYTYVDD